MVAGAAGAAAEQIPAVALAASEPVAGSPPSPAAALESTVFLAADGIEKPYVTTARTVDAFLSERGLTPAADDFVSQPRDAAVTDGMHITYRSAVPLVLFVGKHKRVLRSSAATVADLLGQQHVKFSARDEVRPNLATPLIGGQVVQVTRRKTWTAHLRARIAPKIVQRFDADLPAGMTRTLARGCAGYRETTVRYTSADDGERTKTVLASRIIRPRPRIIVRGLAAYTSLAHVAAAGFASVLHFAGSALHVIATAYTAQCAGCSGMTASGARAGFGIIAVDPRIIPLGTHLFVPGYGRAVAGDTGGDIQGNRVDLGFDSLADAARFGRRSLTVYVTK